MIVAIVVLIASFVAFWCLNHPYRVKLAWKRLMCDVLDRHSWENVATGYARRYGFSATDPALKRQVLRTRDYVCRRVECLASHRIADAASVSGDWQNPERLFDDSGPLYPAEPLDASAKPEMMFRSKLH